MLSRWKYQSSKGGLESDLISDWASELNISTFLARLLWHRGYTDLYEMNLFLDAGLRHLPALDKWRELEYASEFLAASLQKGEKLAVWGDYDVDGLTASALVKDFLAAKGYTCDVFIPDRLRQGYGLNKAGLSELVEQDTRVLLSVDCGICDIEELEAAEEMGLKTIVTDHHLPKNSLPKAKAIVNPKINQCPYPEVAGVGVAFLLMASLNKKLSGPKIDIREYLDLVALGTIADLVNLDIPNRILVKNGLQMLNKAKRPGIQALKEVSKLPPQGKMDTGSIGFSLAPRLNAAGRIDKPEDALELLLAKDLKRARELAQKLESLNQKRRSLENGIYKQALEQANKQKKRLGLVLYNPDWHEGVIGIVASRIAEYYNRPTLILTSDGSCLKGSGRSVAHFDLYAGLCQCSGLLQQFGGHKQAAGLKVKESKLDELRENFNLAVKNQLGTNVLAPILKLEAKIGLNWIDYNFVKELELLQPFGPGNPEPVFCSKGLMVRNCKVFRKEHISLELRDEEAGRTMFGKAWKAAEKLSLKVKGEKMQFAFTPRFNIYNGLTSIDLQIRDWRYLSSVS